MKSVVIEGGGFDEDEGMPVLNVERTNLGNLGLWIETVDGEAGISLTPEGVAKLKEAIRVFETS